MNGAGWRWATSLARRGRSGSPSSSLRYTGMSRATARFFGQSTLSKRQLKSFRRKGRRLTQIREHFNEKALQAKLFAEPIGHQGGQTAVQKDIGELLVGTSQDHITKVKDSLDAFAFAASRSSTNEFIEPTTAACRNKAKNREKLARTCWRQLPPGSPEGEQRH